MKGLGDPSKAFSHYLFLFFRSKEETVETKAETSKPTVYRLTEDNLHAISPMIGLTEEEIAAFFDIKKDD